MSKEIQTLKKIAYAVSNIPVSELTKTEKNIAMCVSEIGLLKLIDTTDGANYQITFNLQEMW